jgi:DNA polymerase III delta subunit
MRQVEKTALIRSLLDKGVSETDIAVLVGMKEWPFKNVAAPIARKHDLKSLLKHMGQLCKLDADVKGPARSKRTLVELTMLSIAQ